MYIGCHGGLAQLVEQLIYTEKVTGSSPVSPTRIKIGTTCLCLFLFLGYMDEESRTEALM